MSSTVVTNKGNVLRVDMKTDVTTATVLRLDYKKPDGTTGNYTPTVSGTNYWEYVFQTGDIDSDDNGTWTAQPYIEIGDFKGYFKAFTFQVKAKFEL